ncbi:MAG: DEAD/DEAH box helicase family protein [Clostridia bacterium]|nr:DEAD/DEAH box helicase family protein [Clostridia bacterium]
MDLPLDFENAFSDDDRVKDVRAEDPADGLFLSLRNLGRVDMEYVSAVCGMPLKDVVTALKGVVYQNPETWGECFYKGWETADEYLTGALKRKLTVAKSANVVYEGWFDDNVRALEKVLPPTVRGEEIFVTLGSPWVPADVIDEFILYLLGKPVGYSADFRVTPPSLQVRHDEYTGTWDIPEKTRYVGMALSNSVYGIPRMTALNIIERTLNMKTVVVKDEVYDPHQKSNFRRVVNKKETVAALERQKLILDKFRSWIWTDPDRKKRLEEIYEEKFGSYKRRRFDGSFLRFPNMSPKVSLYDYQKDAVARILFSPNTLLAHDVGSGKTYVMIAAAMEMRRMGVAKKNLFVVPNNIVGQWKEIFLTMYPDADLFIVEPKIFSPAKRNETLRKIRDEDHDGIIMAYSCFDRIPLSLKAKNEQITEEMEALKRRKESIMSDTHAVDRRITALSKRFAELLQIKEALKDVVCFDELGVDRLYVDEAHNYKNVPIDTQIDVLTGINPNGSVKCREMMEKVHFVQKKNGGSGVVMATGTPITNSITDAYIFQRYLQSGELALMDLLSFDAWVGMFAERATEFEIDVDTSSYRMATRFSRFHNLTELTALLSSIADFHRVEGEADLPVCKGRTDVLVRKTKPLADFLKVISNRADAVRNGRVRMKEDNMLKITTDGRLAALDLRLLDPKSPFLTDSKVAYCAKNVSDIWHRTANLRSTQLVFCDTSTPKEGFNIYDDMKRILTTVYRVPDFEIAFVHDADTDKKREELFEKVRRGEIRVLIGSTLKLGLGVNVQDRLLAVHHLDVPWRPADMVQREGRIIRQGNRNKEVFVYRYVTEGSFDAYSWQLLETKQRFIGALLSGSLDVRSEDDVDGTALDYGEVKALAVGNPKIKKRVETENRLNRYRMMQAKWIEQKEYLMLRLEELPKEIDKQKTLIEEVGADVEYVENTVHRVGNDEKRVLSEQLYDAVLENDMKNEETDYIEYRGFLITLPANMLKESPFLYLKRAHRYRVEVGARAGVIRRVDNCIDELRGRLIKYGIRLDELTEQKAQIEAELQKEVDYADRIEVLKQELKEIDKELKIDK